MSISHLQVEGAISSRLGKPVGLSLEAFNVLRHLHEKLPMTSWELGLLHELLTRSPGLRSQCHLLVDFRYRDLLAIFEGHHRYTEYQWREGPERFYEECVQEGPDLRGSLLWRLRLPQPDSLEGVLDMLLGPRPTGGVNVVYVDAEPVPVEETVAWVFGLDDLMYLLFRTLYAGSRISDTGIVLLLLAGRTDSELHLGRYNRWFLDGFEGLVFETGDPLQTHGT